MLTLIAMVTEHSCDRRPGAHRRVRVDGGDDRDKQVSITINSYLPYMAD